MARAKESYFRNCNGTDHFTADGFPYVWVKPIWEKQKVGFYPPMKCLSCGQEFEEKSNRLDLQEYRLGICTIRVWKIPGNWYKTMPWRFSIQEDDKSETLFSGIPNYCCTKRSAMKRAWYRAKWINEGTWKQHYK